MRALVLLENVNMNFLSRAWPQPVVVAIRGARRDAIRLGKAKTVTNRHKPSQA